MTRLLWTLAAGTGLCIAVGVYMAEIATHVYEALRWLPPRSVAEAVAAQAHAKLLDVEIAAADGTSLRAWAYLPDRPNGTAVIALHGVGGHRGHMLGFAGMLARNGFIAVTPDNRGHGTSGGRFFTYGVTETSDVSRWTGWALAHTGARRVAGLGESMGAAILLQALRHEPRLSAVAAEAPFASFEQVARGRIEQRASLLALPVLEPGFLYFRLRYGHDLRSASPLESLRTAMARSPAPRVMLIHSPSDRNIPVWHSRLLRDVAPAKIEFWEPEGVAHTQALGTLPEEFERRVVGFPKENPNSGREGGR